MRTAYCKKSQADAIKTLKFSVHDNVTSPDASITSTRHLAALGAAHLAGAPAAAPPHPHLQAFAAIRALPPSWPMLSAFTSIQPAHAVVLSLDEKSQIQALDRTQPGAAD